MAVIHGFKESIDYILAPPRNSQDIPAKIGAAETYLKTFPKEVAPELWASICGNLANNLCRNPLGNRAQDLESAIIYYKSALEVYTREVFSEKWAMIQNNLANAYSRRIMEDRPENIEQAITHYNNALEVYTREAFPVNWAASQNNLGTVYSDRVKEDQAKNIEQAIAHYNNALKVYTREAFPEDWAMTQNNLGNAYRSRIKEDQAKNIEEAIVHYKNALEVRTRAEFSADWAVTQSNIADAYTHRIKEDQAKNIEEAIVHCNNALEVLTSEAFPEDWAMTQNNLGNAYSNRIKEERARNIEQAIAHYNNALKVFTHEAFPEKWAMILNNQGTAYNKRLIGDRLENIEQSIAHYNSALEVRTRAEFSKDWAITQNNLGGAYNNRIEGDRAENIEQAIAHFNSALEVYTREAFPEKWAMTHGNLGGAYYKRIEGDRAENIEQAIDYFNKALGIYTLERYPSKHQLSKRNLGNLYFDEQRWDSAVEAYQSAIKAEKLLLESAHTEEGSQAEVAETAKLYTNTAYALLKLKRYANALERFEMGMARLLVRTLALNESDLNLLPNEIRETIRSLREQIRALEHKLRQPLIASNQPAEEKLLKELQESRSHLNAVIRNAQNENPGFMPGSLDLPAILKHIPTNGALVAILPTSHGSAAIVVKGEQKSINVDDVIWLDEFTVAHVRELIIDMNRNPNRRDWIFVYLLFMDAAERHRKREISNNDFQSIFNLWKNTIDTMGKRLWDEVMGPINDRLSKIDVKNVYLMPSGGLGLFPLHAAWQIENGSTRYFSDDYTVTYLPSVYSLATGRRRLADNKADQKSLFAVSNPTKDLVAADKETDTIAELFKTKKMFKWSAATLENVTNGAARYSATHWHFSCHGYYNWYDPMQSGLVMHGKDILTLADIKGKMKLRGAKLVTLSACETGISEFVINPNEYIGLPAGFIQAGAPGVLSTLWSVEAESAMLLMKRFYELHITENVPASQALAQAQRELRSNSQYAHPYYWAAYIFHGADELNSAPSAG